MHKFFAFLKLVRFPNLIMLVLVQFISWKVFSGEQQIPIFNLALLNIATILIAAGGYLINDFYDYDIDLKNGKQNVFTKQSIKSLAIIYFIIGLTTGFYISFISELYLFLLFLFAFVILWSYATYFSKYKLIGNILISLLIIQSIFIISLFSMFYIVSKVSIPELTILHYALFAFLFNYIREVVKDIEDIEGDKAFGRKTIPILFGINKTKLYVTILFKIALIFIWFSDFYTLIPSLKIVFTVLISAALYFLFKATNKKDFKRLSLMIKLIMLLGLLSPLLFQFA